MADSRFFGSREGREEVIESLGMDLEAEPVNRGDFNKGSAGRKLHDERMADLNDAKAVGFDELVCEADDSEFFCEGVYSTDQVTHNQRKVKVANVITRMTGGDEIKAKARETDMRIRDDEVRF